MNNVPPVRRTHFPRRALFRHMCFWARFVKNVREGNIDRLPLRLRTYIQNHHAEIIVYLCRLQRLELYPYQQRENFLEFLKEVYTAPVEPPPPNPVQMNPNARHWVCEHCKILHRLDNTFRLDDWADYTDGLDEPGVFRLEFPREDYV